MLQLLVPGGNISSYMSFLDFSLLVDTLWETNQDGNLLANYAYSMEGHLKIFELFLLFYILLF